VVRNKRKAALVPREKNNKMENALAGKESPFFLPREGKFPLLKNWFQPSQVPFKGYSKGSLLISLGANGPFSPARESKFFGRNTCRGPDTFVMYMQAYRSTCSAKRLSSDPAPEDFSPVGIKTFFQFGKLNGYLAVYFIDLIEQS